MGTAHGPRFEVPFIADPSVWACGLPLRGDASAPSGIEHDVPGRREATVENYLRRLIEDVDRAVELQRQGCAVMSQIVLLDASEALSGLHRLVPDDGRPALRGWLAARSEVSRRIMASLAFVSADIAAECGQAARDLLASWERIGLADRSAGGAPEAPPASDESVLRSPA